MCCLVGALESCGLTLNCLGTCWTGADDVVAFFCGPCDLFQIESFESSAVCTVLAAHRADTSRGVDYSIGSLYAIWQMRPQGFEPQN